MEDKKQKQLEDKVTDYKQFGFILLSLSIFLFIGLVIPTQDVTQWQGLFIVGIFMMLGCSFVCHRLAMRAQKQLHE